MARRVSAQRSATSRGQRTWKAGKAATPLVEMLESGAAASMALEVPLVYALGQLRVEAAHEPLGRLLDSNEDIGLAAVYRVLTQFESAGLVTRHHFEGGTAVFELNEGEHHDHIVCVDCGRVEEFTDDSIEDRQREIASRLGFEITDHSLTLHGHCVRENCPSRPKQR